MQPPEPTQDNESLLIDTTDDVSYIQLEFHVNISFCLHFRRYQH